MNALKDLTKRPLVLGGLIFLAGLIAYSNSFDTVLIYEDQVFGPEPHFLYGESLFDMPSLPPVLAPLASGYPLSELFLELARDLPRIFHLTSLLFHLMCGLLIFKVITMGLGAHAADKEKENNPWPAFFAALFWVLHPLQTQAVLQPPMENQVLCSPLAFFFLLYIYAAMRAGQSAHRFAWQAGALFAMALGACVSPGIVLAPLLVWLLDKTLGRGRAKGSVFLFTGSLALAMIVGVRLVFNTSSGFPLFFPYVPLQGQVAAHYLGLVIRPWPLCLDYAWQWPGWMRAGPFFCGLVFLAAPSFWAAFKKKPAGFLMASFFLLLVPTSLFPHARAASEPRMYLALAPLLILGVLGGFDALIRLSEKKPGQAAFFRTLGLVLALGLAFAWGLGTHSRNRDYQDKALLWETASRGQPKNFRALFNYGLALFDKGQSSRGLDILDQAVSLSPDSVRARHFLARALVSGGRFEDALVHYKKLIKKAPYSSLYHEEFGSILLILGKIHQGAAVLEEAVRLGPSSVNAHNNLGQALLALKDLRGALNQFTLALEKDPENPDAHSFLGLALAYSGRVPEAEAHLRKALALDPGFVQARLNLASFLTAAGRKQEARELLETALRMHPDNDSVRERVDRAKQELGNADRPLENH